MLPVCEVRTIQALVMREINDAYRYSVQIHSSQTRHTNIRYRQNQLSNAAQKIATCKVESYATVGSRLTQVGHARRGSLQRVPTPHWPEHAKSLHTGPRREYGDGRPCCKLRLRLRLRLSLICRQTQTQT